MSAHVYSASDAAGPARCQRNGSGSSNTGRDIFRPDDEEGGEINNMVDGRVRTLDSPSVEVS